MTNREEIHVHEADSAATGDRVAQVSPDSSRFGYRPELRRSLGFADLLFYGLVFMVPIAPMGIFGSVYAGAGGMVALAYVVGMVALVFTAASYAQMVKAFRWQAASTTTRGEGSAHPSASSRAGPSCWTTCWCRACST